MRRRSHHLSALGVLLAAGAVAALAGREFATMRALNEVHAGPGVTRIGRLAEYLPALAGSPGDTPVYELAGSKPGGTVLVLGGTHGDEPAGYVAAVVLAESARVDAGRLLVIPRANASGFTHNVPQEGHPQRFTIATSKGPRTFTFGARATNPTHQWPDPQVYTHWSSGQALSGLETRNLNRAYPGRSEGTLTERIAFAIKTLIVRERVDLALDLHEAAPEYPVVNTLVAHERAAELAALANLSLQAQGVAIGLEASPVELRGLSHREWGDSTSVLAVLIETANPAQGRLRGRTDAGLVVGGQDRYYELAARRSRLSVLFDHQGLPLALRVGRHLAAVARLTEALGELWPEKRVVLVGVPGYEDIVARGVGAFLN